MNLNELIEYTGIKPEFKTEDLYIGNLINENNQYNSKINLSLTSKEKVDNICSKKSTKNGSIVVIIESPHIDEFKKTYSVNQKNIYLPARGKTGKNIEEHLSKHLDGCLINKEVQSNFSEQISYPIFLCNSIQYQTSLGKTPEKHRTKNWYAMWLSQKIRNEFIARVQLLNPTLILNCATLGAYNSSSLESDNSMNKSLTMTKKFTKYILDDMRQKGLKVENLEQEVPLIPNKNKYSIRNHISSLLLSSDCIESHLFESSHPSSKHFINVK